MPMPLDTREVETGNANKYSTPTRKNALKWRVLTNIKTHGKSRVIFIHCTSHTNFKIPRRPKACRWRSSPRRTSAPRPPRSGRSRTSPQGRCPPRCGLPLSARPGNARGCRKGQEGGGVARERTVWDRRALSATVLYTSQSTRRRLEGKHHTLRVHGTKGVYLSRPE